MKFRPLEIAGQQSYEGGTFPLGLECPDNDAALDEVCQSFANSRSELRAALDGHGAILFRGFPVRADLDFDRVIESLQVPNFRYKDSLSNAVRVNRTERVFTANEAPPEVTIYMHHEMAQTPVYPSSLFFFCEKAAEEGGATPLCRSDVLLEQMEGRFPRFVADCRAKGLRYSNVMPPHDDASSGMGRSWRSTLSSKTQAEAETRLRKLGYEWEWEDGECLRVTTPVLPAVRRLANGRSAFFNQLIAAFKGWKDTRNDPSKAICFGDGSPLDRDAVLQSAEMADELAFDVPWHDGDIAWVDNFSTMHGRRSFSGTRKVLASLVANESDGE